MFSEITRMRPACARRPEVSIPIDRVKSLMSSAMIVAPYSPALALADRSFQQMQALAVERGDRRIIHLVGGYLHHLFLETDAIAGGLGLEADLAVDVEGAAAAAGWRDMARTRLHHGQRSHRTLLAAGGIELGLDQVARLEFRRVGVGDVFRQHALPGLVPLHLGTQRRQDRKIADRHRAAPPVPSRARRR